MIDLPGGTFIPEGKFISYSRVQTYPSELLELSLVHAEKGVRAVQRPCKIYLSSSPPVTILISYLQKAEHYGFQTEYTYRVSKFN